MTGSASANWLVSKDDERSLSNSRTCGFPQIDDFTGRAFSWPTLYGTLSPFNRV